MALNVIHRTTSTLVAAPNAAELSTWPSGIE